MNLLLLLLLGARPAPAYSPETLLARALTAVPEVEAPGEHQHLNPFNRVIWGYQHGFGSESGQSSPDKDGRTRFRTDDKREDELRLELRPKGLSEAREYKRFALALRNGAAVERKLLQSRATENAYKLLIQAALAREEQSLVAEWKAVLEKAQLLGSLEARRSESSAKSLLRTQAEIDKARSEIVEIDGKVAAVSAALEGRGLALGGLDSSGIIEPAGIGARLGRLAPAPASLSRQVAESDLELARASLAHGAAERGRLVEAVKLGVNLGRDSITRRTYDPADASSLIMLEGRKATAYKMEISFNLPFLAAQNLDEQRDRLKYARMEAEKRQAEEEESSRNAGLASMLREKIELFGALGSALSGKDPAKGLLAQDPALALELQRTSVNRRLLRARLLAEIRTLYIELLRERGSLAELPDRNLLANDERRI